MDLWFGCDAVCCESLSNPDRLIQTVNQNQNQNQNQRETMRAVSALMVARMLTRDHSLPVLGNESIPFGSVWWFAYAGVSCFLVLFAGIMSGLTLGLMSLGLVDLEILERSGSPAEKMQAGTSSFSFLSSFTPNYPTLIFLCRRVYMQRLYFLWLKNNTSFLSPYFSVMLLPWR